MKNNFNIDRYLNEAEERFSGFYGEDYDDFDGDDLYSYYNAQGGGMDMLKSPAPYQLTVVNSTAGNLTMVIFGNNANLLSTNFGSSVGLSVLLLPKLTSPICSCYNNLLLNLLKRL